MDFAVADVLRNDQKERSVTFKTSNGLRRTFSTTKIAFAPNLIEGFTVEVENRNQVNRQFGEILLSYDDVARRVDLKMKVPPELEVSNSFGSIEHQISLTAKHESLAQWRATALQLPHVLQTENMSGLDRYDF